jgi:hypothetical protein
MHALYDSPDDASLHEDAIESLVQETHLPIDVVRAVYEGVLVRLKPEARVREYLVLFAVRQAREALRPPRR